VKRMMRWEMAILRESPWYREILAEGLEIGRREGLEEGLEAGRQEGLEEGLEAGRRQSLLDLLTKRFKSVPERIETRLAARHLPDLVALLDVALDVDSLEEFETHLEELERGQAQEAIS
jgi:predicted transposase YdaD